MTTRYKVTVVEKGAGRYVIEYGSTQEIISRGGNVTMDGFPFSLNLDNDIPDTPPNVPKPKPPHGNTGSTILTKPGTFHRPEPGNLASIVKLPGLSSDVTSIIIEYTMVLDKEPDSRRLQAHFCAVDGRYRGGVLGFVFLNGLRNWTLRHGLPGQNQEMVKDSFKVDRSSNLEYRIQQVYDISMGMTSVEVRDVNGSLLGSVASNRQTFNPVGKPPLHIVFGFDTVKYPNDQEQITQGEYRDLEVSVY